jgi:hypothetical protein
MDQYLDAFHDPMNVHVVDDEIVILGPDGVAISLTIEAAEESARRLAEAVKTARDQPPGVKRRD